MRKFKVRKVKKKAILVLREIKTRQNKIRFKGS